MPDFDPDAYLADKPAAKPAGFDPDAYLAGSVQGAAKETLAPSNLLTEAVKPLTSIPSTYADINRETRKQMARGMHQITSPESGWDIPSGALNVLGGGLGYVASPFYGPMRALGSQPIENVTGIPKEYTEFAAALLPWMPKGTGAVTRGATATKTVAPTAEELAATAGRQFDAARASGVEVPAYEIAALATEVGQTLRKSGARQATTPKTLGLLGELEKVPEGAIADVGDLHGIRQALGDIAASPDKSERRAAKIVINSLDRYLQGVSPELKTAIGNYAAAQRSGTVTGRLLQAEDATAAANSGMNLGNTIRQKFKSILADPAKQRGFNEEEIDAMRKIVRGSYTGDALRIAGNILGGGGGLGSLAAAAAGAHAEGLAGAIGFPAVGMGVRQLGNALTVRKVNALDEMIRARSPLGADMAAQQAEREAAKRWAHAYINSQANPTPGNVRALNATSRGLALILNRNLGTDVNKAIPWLQNPAAGVATEQEQVEVPRPPAQQNHGGAVENKQGFRRGGHVSTTARRPNGKSQALPKVNPAILKGARRARDGKFYIEDPSRPGKFLRIDMK